MTQEISPVPPEADLIRIARQASGLTMAAAAKAAKAIDPAGEGISAPYWRSIEANKGGRRSKAIIPHVSDEKLALMARVVGVTPRQLADVGRDDAARVLAEMLRRERPAAVTRIGPAGRQTVPPPGIPERFANLTPDTSDPARFVLPIPPAARREFETQLAVITAEYDQARKERPDGPLTGAQIFGSLDLARHWDDQVFARSDEQRLYLLATARALAVMYGGAEAQRGRAAGTG